MMRFKMFLAGLVVAVSSSIVSAGEPITSFGVSANGRRFLINGKAVFLAGFREGYVGGDWNNVYWNHQNLPSSHPISPNAAQVNYSAYAAAVLNAGMNLVRCNLISMQAGSGRVHGTNERTDAYNYPPTNPLTERPWARTGGGQAWDNWPRYNLNEWNNWYWTRLAEWVQTANANGIVIEVTLFQQHNYYQLFTHYADNPLRPYNCNPTTALPNGFGETAYPEYYETSGVHRAAQEALCDKVVDTLYAYPGVIYRIGEEYNWTDTWLETLAARMKARAATYGKSLVMQVGGTMQQMKLMNNDIHSMDGTFILQEAGGSFCDPPSLVEVRLPGYCTGTNNEANVHATMLKMWNELPGKACYREGESTDKAWWGALTGGAAGYFYHGAFESGFTGAMAKAVTRLVNEYMEEFETSTPHDEYVLGGTVYMLATPGKEYLAYFPNGGSGQINLSSASGQMRYSWYNPRTQAMAGGGTVTAGGASTFSAPDTQDWVLWLRRQVPPAEMTDFDDDGDVDLEDFGFFQSCYSGSGVAPRSGCGAADLDGDNDVDQADFTIFKSCFGGANKSPSC